jgi:hypothetical protein
MAPKDVKSSESDGKIVAKWAEEHKTEKKMRCCCSSVPSP